MQSGSALPTADKRASINACLPAGRAIAKPAFCTKGVFHVFKFLDNPITRPTAAL
jgi:hypothetical protein